MSNEIAIATQSQHVFANSQSYEAAKLMAGALSKSTLVPKEYINNLPNCLIALEISQRIGASPLQVMQNLYIVHGRPSWSSQFIIASINSCGRFKPLRFEFSGVENTDDWGCVAWTVERDIDLPKNIRTLGQAIEADLPVLKSTKITIKMAKAEGWYSKAGSKWQTMPEQMMQYRTSSFFGRIYAPDILMGMRSEDEVRDMVDVTPPESSILNNLNAAIKAGPVVTDVTTETAQESVAEEASATTEVLPPEQKPEFTLIGWQKELNNAETVDALETTYFDAAAQFQGDQIALNAITGTRNKRLAILKKEAA